MWYILFLLINIHKYIYIKSNILFLDFHKAEKIIKIKSFQLYRILDSSFILVIPSFRHVQCISSALKKLIQDLLNILQSDYLMIGAVPAHRVIIGQLL